ncbi:MAG TPA: hypothetical protein VFP43_02875 [Mesorhizobium sp.]|nr:hypothetical protein [Mesorhizobium sp.]
MEVKLPQHEGDGVCGGEVTLADNGTFAIGGFDGITVLTKEQAREIAAMLLKWADKP